MLGSGSKKRRAGVQGTLLYMPAILIIFGIVVYPMLYALVMSFTGYSVRKPVMNFIGVANYINIKRCFILAGSSKITYVYFWVPYSAGGIGTGNRHFIKSSGSSL